jgi:hypothetical protein
MDIICISSTSWEGDYVKSTTELMKHMAKRHRVLFVDYNYTYKDVMMSLLKKSPAPVRRIFGLQNRLQLIKVVNDSTLWLLTLPSVFPVNFIKNKKCTPLFNESM